MSKPECCRGALIHPRKSPWSQGREGGCGNTTVTGKQARTHKEKRWNLRGLQKQSEHKSTFCHGHVSLGIGKGTLSFRAFLQTTTSIFILSELLLHFAPFPGLGIILGKRILQKRGRGTPSCDRNPRKVLCGLKSVSVLSDRQEKPYPQWSVCPAKMWEWQNLLWHHMWDQALMLPILPKALRKW